MNKKRYTTLFFDDTGQKEKYTTLLAWEAATKGKLLTAKLTAPKEEAQYYVFKYDFQSGNFSILANRMTVYSSYSHCFTYTTTHAYFSYKKAENKFYYKGKAKQRAMILRFLIAKKLKIKLGLDFLKEEDISFIRKSIPLIHKLFSKEITSQINAWKFYLLHHYKITGNINYTFVYRQYLACVQLKRKIPRNNYVAIFFKLLLTSDNIQRDVRHYASPRKLLWLVNHFTGLITGAYLLQRKINYTVSKEHLEDIYARQKEELLQLRIENGLIPTASYIPFLPAIVEFSLSDVNFYLLNDAMAFHKEAIAMRNCIFSCVGFKENLTSGEALYFSVRSTSQASLRGTLEVYINDYKPLLRQFKSRMNQFDLLHPNNEKLPFSVAFLNTTTIFLNVRKPGVSSIVSVCILRIASNSSE